MIGKFIPLLAGLIVILLLAINYNYWWPALRHALPTVLRVAGLTIAEARRRRVLHVTLLLVILILVSTSIFTYMQPGEEANMLMSTGLGWVLFFGMLLSIFVGAFLIPKEIETRTIYAVLSKPVRRAEFVLGKYVGALAVVGFVVVIMGGALMLTLWGKSMSLGKQQAETIATNLGTVAISLGMYYVMLAVFTSLIIMVSTVASTTMTVISSVLLWAVGLLQGTIHHISERAAGASSLFLKVMQVALPNFELFDFRRNIVQGVAPPMDHIVGALGWGVLYTAVALTLGVVFFNDRQV